MTNFDGVVCRIVYLDGVVNEAPCYFLNIPLLYTRDQNEGMGIDRIEIEIKEKEHENSIQL